MASGSAAPGAHMELAIHALLRAAQRAGQPGRELALLRVPAPSQDGTDAARASGLQDPVAAADAPVTDSAGIDLSQGTASAPTAAPLLASPAAAMHAAAGAAVADAKAEAVWDNRASAPALALAEPLAIGVDPGAASGAVLAAPTVVGASRPLGEGAAPTLAHSRLSPARTVVLRRHGAGGLAPPAAEAAAPLGSERAPGAQAVPVAVDGALAAPAPAAAAAPPAAALTRHNRACAACAPASAPSDAVAPGSGAPASFRPLPTPSREVGRAQPLDARHAQPLAQPRLSPVTPSAPTLQAGSSSSAPPEARAALSACVPSLLAPNSQPAPVVAGAAQAVPARTAAAAAQGAQSAAPEPLAPPAQCAAPARGAESGAADLSAGGAPAAPTGDSAAAPLPHEARGAACAADAGGTRAEGAAAQGGGAAGAAHGAGGASGALDPMDADDGDVGAEPTDRDVSAAEAVAEPAGGVRGPAAGGADASVAPAAMAPAARAGGQPLAPPPKPAAHAELDEETRAVVDSAEALRLSLGLKLCDFASKLSINPSAYSKWRALDPSLPLSSRRRTTAAARDELERHRAAGLRDAAPPRPRARAVQRSTTQLVHGERVPVSSRSVSKRLQDELKAARERLRRVEVTTTWELVKEEAKDTVVPWRKEVDQAGSWDAMRRLLVRWSEMVKPSALAGAKSFALSRWRSQLEQVRADYTLEAFEQACEQLDDALSSAKSFQVIEQIGRDHTEGVTFFGGMSDGSRVYARGMSVLAMAHDLNVYPAFICEIYKYGTKFARAEDTWVKLNWLLRPSDAVAGTAALPTAIAQQWSCDPARVVFTTPLHETMRADCIQQPCRALFCPERERAARVVREAEAEHGEPVFVYDSPIDALSAALTGGGGGDSDSDSDDDYGGGGGGSDGGAGGYYKPHSVDSLPHVVQELLAEGVEQATRRLARILIETPRGRRGGAAPGAMRVKPPKPAAKPAAARPASSAPELGSTSASDEGSDDGGGTSDFSAESSAESSADDDGDEGDEDAAEEGAEHDAAASSDSDEQPIMARVQQFRDGQRRGPSAPPKQPPPEQQRARAKAAAAARPGVARDAGVAREGSSGAKPHSPRPEGAGPSPGAARPRAKSPPAAKPTQPSAATAKPAPDKGAAAPPPCAGGAGGEASQSHRAPPPLDVLAAKGRAEDKTRFKIPKKAAAAKSAAQAQPEPPPVALSRVPSGLATGVAPARALPREAVLVRVDATGREPARDAVPPHLRSPHAFSQAQAERAPAAGLVSYGGRPLGSDVCRIPLPERQLPARVAMALAVGQERAKDVIERGSAVEMESLALVNSHGTLNVGGTYHKGREVERLLQARLAGTSYMQTLLALKKHESKLWIWLSGLTTYTKKHTTYSACPAAAPHRCTCRLARRARARPALRSRGRARARRGARGVTPRAHLAGRHFTKTGLLTRVASMLLPYLNPETDTYVDFCAGNNEFAPMLGLRFRSIDILPHPLGSRPREAELCLDCNESGTPFMQKENWLAVEPRSLPPGELVIGLNPPFGNVRLRRRRPRPAPPRRARRPPLTSRAPTAVPPAARALPAEKRQGAALRGACRVLLPRAPDRPHRARLDRPA